ncbi:hypothetical protein [Streptococcus sp. SS-4456]|uniref:hypothetical protein n=1 Tax=Streptococcus sp. SS-4456 TaxID=3072286 RepID=UPI002FCB229D
MNKIKYLLVESTQILKSVKWDYAKMAQLVKLWGGPKKAVLAFATITATIASVATLSFQKLFKNFMSRLTPKKSNKDSDQNEIDKLIQLKTEEYLNNVQERKNNNLSTDDIDKEYNDFIKSLLENNNTTQQ